jgi:hypothetical protein
MIYKIGESVTTRGYRNGVVRGVLRREWGLVYEVQVGRKWGWLTGDELTRGHGIAARRRIARIEGERAEAWKPLRAPKMAAAVLSDRREV